MLKNKNRFLIIVGMILIVLLAIILVAVAVFDFSGNGIATLFGFLGAIVAAYIGGLYVNKVARQRMTMDLLIKADSDSFYREIYSTFSAEAEKTNGKIVYKNLKPLKKKNREFARELEKAKGKNKKLKKEKEELEKDIQQEEKKQYHIDAFLNLYELIATGIDHGILDEAIIKKYMESILSKDFERAEQYIKGAREAGYKGAWIEFEGLVNRWCKKSAK